MRLAFLLFVFSIFYGCMPNRSLSTAAEAEVNVYGIFRLERGMNQAEVLKIMRHPYSDKVFVMDQDIYDVWFYVTSPTVLGQSRMMPANLTPVTFKNGILIGCGNYYYNTLKNMQLEKEKAMMAPPSPPIPTETEKEIENKELEESLQKTLQPQSPTIAPKVEQPIQPQEQGATPQKPAGSAPPQKKPVQPNQKGPNWSPVEKPAAPQAGQGKAQPGGASQPKNQKQELQKPSQTNPHAPNWSPIEKQAPEQQPPATPPQKLSMSDKQGSQEDSAQEKDPKNTKENRVPLTEEDEEMLREEREYDFDQT
jgi:hypothetical protein